MIEKDNSDAGMSWMNRSPLYNDVKGYEDDPVVQEQVEEARVSSNKKMEKLFERGGSTEPSTEESLVQ